MKRNKGDAEDFESSEESDASDNERQPAWLHNAASSPFERPPRKSSAYPGNEHRDDRHGDRKDGFRARSGARGGYERAHTGYDSKREGYSSREEGRLMPIDADVLVYFPDPGAVNQALRALIPIIDARGARGERGTRRANSPHYGDRERSEHSAGRSATPRRDASRGYAGRAAGRSAPGEAFGRTGRSTPGEAFGRAGRSTPGEAFGRAGRSATPRRDASRGSASAEARSFPPDRPPFARKRPRDI
jgi:hypothetical protein